MSGVRLLALALLLARAVSSSAEDETLPLRQSRLDGPGAGPPLPITLEDASRDDRWLGAGIRFRDLEGHRDLRWSPDGRWLYFRWNPDPRVGEDPEADPWFRVDRAGRRAARVAQPDEPTIPASEVSWTARGDRAAWESDGRVFFFDAAAGSTRIAYAAAAPARGVRIQPDGTRVRFLVGEDLHEWRVATGEPRQLTRRHERKEPSEAAIWLQDQQRELFETQRAQRQRERAAESRQRAQRGVQALPVESGFSIEDVRLSPDGRHVAFRVRRPSPKRTPTRYADYASASGQAEIREARPKVGDPQDEFRFGIVRVDPALDPEELKVVWVEPKEASGEPTIVYGPEWSIEGRRAIVQVASRNYKDRWISALDLETGATAPIVHEHDDAWLGGPSPLSSYLEPALLEWLPGERFVFASERSGFCHLYLAERDGRIRALTEGSWEVRQAALSRDRATWLIQAGREHPCDDHLYVMPAEGGPMARLTRAEGRHAGLLSPDGSRLAVVSSDSTHLPDLFLTDPRPGAASVRVTRSGTDNYERRLLVTPAVVSFAHPDGRPVWAAVFDPAPERKNGAAILHIHGGGYRQFSHRGYSVYGWGLHLGLVQHLVEKGYTVLDFDYRGGAGFGRAYRTDIYRSMGDKDVAGGVAAVDWLVRERGIDRSRIGVYGLSYGGFFTLMALFKHPGVFAAGVANASVSDWAHYEHDWTSRILGAPVSSADAYRRSSPIYLAEGLRDPLLIVHGLIDDNVHFQDSARLVQRLIELRKEFDVAIYPSERHTIETESSRLDYVRRTAAFFDRHLR